MGLSSNEREGVASVYKIEIHSRLSVTLAVATLRSSIVTSVTSILHTFAHSPYYTDTAYAEMDATLGLLPK